MNPSRHERLRELFLAASELPESQQIGYLNTQAADDAELRDEVLALLEHDASGEDLLSAPLVAPELLPRNIVDPAPGAELSPGFKIGAYTIEALIGVGGMGAVYRARQDKPSRTVALKVIRAGMASPSLLRRMELEAELLGRLHHPGIAQIYQAGYAKGESADIPYFAMEFIDGPNLIEHVRRISPTLAQRIELVLKVCVAVEHAHQKGVIHRDLKPGNILIDPAGQPKVVDFGVARATDPAMHVTTIRTGIGQLVGTLQYMSPEQVSGDPAAVDTRTDVYALGVILYQLLTGRLPHDLASRSIPEAARIIRDEEPAPLSSIDRSLRGELDIIVARAMNKSSDRRYQSAAMLAEDLQRFLDGQPISARADSALYILRKRIARYRGIVAAACISLIALVIVASIAVRQANHANESRQLAEGALASEKQQREIAVNERERADKLRSQAEAHAEELRRSDYISRIAFAQAALNEGDILRVRHTLDLCPTDLRGWEWNYLNRTSDLSVDQRLVFPDSINSVAIGTHAIAMCHFGKPIRVLDSDEHTEVLTVPTQASFAVPAMSPDGRVLAVIDQGKATLYKLPTGASFREFSCDKVFSALVLNSDASRLLCATNRSEVVVLSTESGLELFRAKLDTAFIVATFAADDQSAFVGLIDGSVRLIGGEAGVQLARWETHNGGVRALALAPDGQRLAVGGVDGTVSIWMASDRSATQPVVKNRVHTNKVTALAWNPNGKTIATGSTDDLIHVLDASTGEVLSTYPGHTRTVTALNISGDGSRLTSASLDGTVRWWSLQPGLNDRRSKLPAGVFGAAVFSDGSRLVVGGNMNRLLELDLASLKPVAAIDGRPAVLDVVLADDEQTVLTAQSDGHVEAWDRAARRHLRTLMTFTSTAESIGWCPARRLVAAASDDGDARIVEFDSGKEVFRFHSQAGGIAAVAMNHAGTLIAISERDGKVQICDVQSGARQTTLEGPGEFAWQIVWTADDSSLLAGRGDGSVLQWPAAGGLPRTFLGHTGPVFRLAISPDGTRLVTGGFDNTVRLWDMRSATEFLTLRGHTSSIHGLTFSPDGNRILSCSDIGAVVTWNALPLAEPATK